MTDQIDHGMRPIRYIRGECEDETLLTVTVPRFQMGGLGLSLDDDLEYFLEIAPRLLGLEA